MVSLHQRGEGEEGRARPRATNDALHAVRSSRRSLSLRLNVSIASTQACHTTKTEPNSGSVSDCVRRQRVVPSRPAPRLPEEQRTPLRSLLKMQQSPWDIALTPRADQSWGKCFGRPNSQSDAHLRCALRATGPQPHAPSQTRLSHQSLSAPLGVDHAAMLETSCQPPPWPPCTWLSAPTTRWTSS